MGLVVVCGLATGMVGAASASGSYGGNCALYARSITGVALDGNAGAWWAHAEGHYQRGQQPAVGAILVFKPSGHMRSGHVAVVSRVVNRREILVDQANWIRGRVVKNMSVVDASPENDWSSVRVIELQSNTHGRENPTYGFIYPGDSLKGDDAILTASAKPPAFPVRLASYYTAATSSEPAENASPKHSKPAEADATGSTKHTKVANAAPPPPPHKPKPVTH
jgi:surface antigen